MATPAVRASAIVPLFSMETWQESRSLEEQCQEQTRLGQEFAEEAQEWVLLAGTLADEVKVLREAASMMPELKKVGNAT